MTIYRNSTHAFVGLLSKLQSNGREIDVRGSKTIELQSELIELTNPRERCIILPGRRNNIFASIAETMWVLSGRNDMEFLSSYLRRAKEFSDDGQTWRAGYGPRLRNWNGVDQLAQVRRILEADPNSRRAVISLLDPDRDFVESKDVPCNNWLHFLNRDGRLHLNVAARSTDIVWGFSGINAFEWSVLQEIMAYWLGLDVGNFKFFTSSLHIYERHYGLIPEVLDSFKGRSMYDEPRQISSFATTWADFDRSLNEWFKLEVKLRNGHQSLELESLTFSDPLFIQYIQMIDIYWSYCRQVPRGVLDSKIRDLRDSDLSVAAAEFINR